MARPAVHLAEQDGYFRLRLYERLTMSEYCTPSDLQNRLTSVGYDNVVDRDQDGDITSEEVASSVTSSISWAGGLIDACLCERFNTASARTSGNSFLRDRCIDLAACRLATQGGRDAPAAFLQDQQRALAMLERIRDAGDPVPGLSGSAVDWKASGHEVFEIPSNAVT